MTILARQISVLRSFVRPQADGKLKNENHLFERFKIRRVNNSSKGAQEQDC